MHWLSSSFSFALCVLGVRISWSLGDVCVGWSCLDVSSVVFGEIGDGLDVVLTILEGSDVTSVFT